VPKNLGSKPLLQCRHRANLMTTRVTADMRVILDPVTKIEAIITAFCAIEFDPHRLGSAALLQELCD